MKKRIIAFLLMSIMLLSSMTNVMAVSFSDLDSGHWAYKYISPLVDQGVINGYTDGTYKPEKTITRGEFFKLIITASEGEAACKSLEPFFEKWTEPYMYMADKMKVMKNETSLTDVDIPITRNEMATVLSKVCIRKGITKVYSEDGSDIEKIEFIDLDSIDEFDKYHIENVVSLGLIKGYTDMTFKPEKNMTRAEVATIIYRFSTIK